MMASSKRLRSLLLPACRRAIVALFLRALLLLNLVWTPGTVANHNKWWTCNDACARCARRVLPIDDMITNLYPGLFSTAPPANAFPVADLVDTMNIQPRPNYTISGGAVNDTPTVGVDGYLDSNSNQRIPTLGSPPPPTSPPSASGCCETVTEYATPPNVTVRGKVYRVVHLRHMFQFIPIGRCRVGSQCGGGQCVDQFRAHWVLVFNNTRPFQGPVPVSFTPIEVPSHCECVNVGQP